MRRHTPLPRRAARPKRRAPAACSMLRCRSSHAPVHVTPAEAYCTSHADDVADDLASRLVRSRDGSCVSCGGPPSDHDHIQTRGKHAIRWLIGDTTAHPGNGVALCRLCHGWFTVHPHAWRRFVDLRWPGLWEQLDQVVAYAGATRMPVDVGRVISELRARLEAAA